jgi:uncharacterized membrane protein
VEWLQAAISLAFWVLALLVWSALSENTYGKIGAALFVFWGFYLLVVALGATEYVPIVTNLGMYFTVGWLILHFGKLIVDERA